MEKERSAFMKILFLVTNFNFVGGKERYDRDVLRVLEEEGMNVGVVRLKGRGLMQKIGFVLRAFFGALYVRPDALFASHVSFSPFAYALKKYMSIPYVVFTAGTEVWDIKKSSIKKALTGARFVVVISEYTKEKLRAQLPKLQKKFFYIPPTVREELFVIKEKPEEGFHTLLTVARLRPNEEEKGYLKVIDTLPALMSEFPDIRYFIIGAVLQEFGDNRERIRAYAKERGVEKNVIVVGEVSDKELADYYNLCDVFVMPSTQEGFGIVFLEALASGRPVIAGNRDGSRDALLNGRMGLLVNPEDVEEIREAIRMVLKKEVPSELLDAEHLRKETLRAYGFAAFRARVLELLHEFQSR